MDKDAKKQYNKEYRLKNQCEHNKFKPRCKECGGNQFCQHGKRKYDCKECGGSSICEHNRNKLKCADCGGSQFCIHKKYKSRCKECGGSNFCQHGRRKYDCKECGGSSICEHNRHKLKCIDCGLSQVCEHKKIINGCRECGGSSFCEHGKIKAGCIECGGSRICEHKKRKYRCYICSLSTYLVELQRRSLRRLLEMTSIQKVKHTIEYLGCDSEYFMEYIKSKMTDEMTFENIHIDHIKPVSKFNLEIHDDFLKCCHYTNMQPLLSKDNLEKSNKWTEENEIFWGENIIYKEYMELYF